MTDRTPIRHGLDFAFVDVFADVPLAGNPLAVVPGADALTDAEMAGIAREFNQSETTFVTDPTRVPAGFPTRIEQGHRLRRPSVLDIEVTAGGVRLGGRCAISATGTLRC